MQKQLKNLSGVTPLSRSAQKNISGGVWTCSCTGHAGTWYYTSTPTISGMINDLNTYCRNGGSCANVAQ